MNHIAPHLGGRERGSSLVEMLVNCGIVSIVLASVVAMFTSTSRSNFDERLIQKANEEARILLDILAFDIRMAGSGMPMGQALFSPTDAALGTAPLPVLLTSTNSTLRLRLNENGRDTMLTATYTPSAASLSFTVVSAADIGVGDTIYICDFTQGGTSGLRGSVTAINGTTVTIAAGYVASAGASFASGSVVSRVTDVVFDSPVSWSGITRDIGGGPVLLAPNSLVTFTYYDSAGALLTPPLTAAQIKDNLAAIDVVVSVRSGVPLRNGNVYTATSTHRVTLRNLILTR